MNSVIKSTIVDGEVMDFHVSYFETMDEALDCYHDIDLKMELVIDRFDGTERTITKEALDDHGTQIDFDYEEVKNGS